MPRRKYNIDFQKNPFFDLKDDEFEDLCRDLFGKSNEVAHTRKLFGKGYKQFGGDVLVQIDDATSYVVQCKHYPKTNFSRNDIEEAVKLFTDHWESHWSKHKVKRFYLAVSRPITTDDQLLAIQEQIERLKNDYEVTFFYWEQDDLTRELKPHTDLVRDYFDNYWWERICPPETNNAAQGFMTSPVADRILNQSFDQIATLLSDQVRDEIEPIRHLARCGKRAEAIKKYFELKEKSFAFLEAKTRAELLSLEIRLRFPLEISISEGHQLIEQIHREDSNFQTIYLEALVNSHEKGFKSALEELTEYPDISTFNLKLSLLINTDNYEEACQIFSSKPEHLTPDSETKRLYSLALLALGKINEAEEIIEEAFRDQPDWEGIRLAKAVILYYSSQSSLILLENPLAFPQPRPWNLIKTDSISQQKRTEAAQIFKDLLASKREDKEEIQLFQSWYLACIADDAEKREDAVSYAQKVLEEQPTHPYILIWVLGRNMPIDFTRSKSALEEKFDVSQRNLPINEALILVPIYLREGLLTKAKQHLNVVKPSLQKIGAEDLFAYWECQIALVKGDTNAIEKRLAQKIKNVELRQNLQVSALLAAYQSNQNQNSRQIRSTRRNLGKRLAKICRKSQDPQYVWLYCQFCHSQKNWSEVIKFSVSLLNKVPTGESLRIVCDAHYQNRQPEKCLELLDKHRHFFPNGELPNDLSRLEAHCWLNAGKPTKASEIARKVFDREKSTTNLLTLVETHRHAGYFSTIKEAVEKMSSLDELTPMQQLHISQMIAPIDQPLAAELWRQVKNRAEEAREVVDAAFIFGNRLGLADETGDLMKLMMEDAKRGERKHRFLNIAEWREMMRERNEHLQEVEKLYLNGKIPIHIYCIESNQPLTVPFHLFANINRENENFRTKFKILIRRGNRILENAEFLKSKTEWKFHLDISTLLLICHLDLLEMLEKFAPIYVTREIIPLLQWEIKNLEEQSQPDQIQAAKIVLQTLASGTIQKFQITKSLSPDQQEKYKTLIKRIGERDVCLLLQAEEEKAIVIDYLPLRNKQNGNAVKTPSALKTILRGWQSVANELLTEGLLTAQSATKCRRAIEKKGDDEIVDTQPLPVGSKLYLTGLTAQHLAKIGIFNEVCRNYQVFLDEQNEQYFINQEQKFENEKDLILWLRNLQEHLRKGFELDLYRGISDERLKDEPEARSRTIEDYRMRSILELILLNGTQEDTVFIDDRWLSGYLTLNNQTPLLTIYEMLLTFRAHEYLDEDEFYEKLYKLRSENFRYLPITRDEIIYHLKHSGENKKSPEFSTLRKYLADCLLDEKWLEKPPVPVNQGNYAEIEFVFACQRAVVEAIGQVWSESETIEIAHSRADALLFDFYIGWFGLQHFFPDAIVHQAGAWNLASDFSYLCLQSMGILANPGLSFQEKNARLEAYFIWLGYIFREHLRSNSAFLERTLYFLISFLTHLSDEIPISEENDENKEDIKNARQKINAMEMMMVNHLPEEVRKPILENETIKQKFAFTPESIYAVGDVQLRGDEFWNAVADGLRGEKAQVRWKNNNDEIIEIKNRSSNHLQPQVELLCQSSKTAMQLKNDVLGLLLPEDKQRLDYIQSNRNNFDCSNDVFATKIKEILDTPELLERVGIYNDWAKHSVQIAYDNLLLEVKERKGFSRQQLAEFPIQGLPEYFRLPIELTNEKSFDHYFEDASEILLRERGIEVALDRFSRFPISIPENLINGFVNSPLEQRKVLIEKFRQEWNSPVGKLHYLSLVLRAVSEDAEILEQARTEAKKVFKVEEENPDFEIFKSLLFLVAADFARESKTKVWALPIRLSLIWAHAAQLYDIFSRLGDNDKEKQKLLKYLNSERPIWNREVFDYEPEFRHDCLHPRLLDRESFLGLTAGSLFAELSSELLDKIDLVPLLWKSCFTELDEKTVSHYEFWKDFTSRTNLTGSFLGEKSFSLFNSLSAFKENTIVFSQESLPETLRSIIQRIIENPSERISWVELIFIADDLPLNSTIHEEFLEVINSLDFQSIWEKDTELALTILSFIIRQKSIMSAETKSKVENFLRWTVGKLAEKYSAKLYPNSENRWEQEDRAISIAEFAAWLTAEPFDPVNSSQRWNELMFNLGQIWSNLPVLLESLFLRMWLDLPVEQLQGIGKNLLLVKVFK